MIESDGDDDVHKTPRWVKVSGALAIALIVAFALLHLAGGGFRHRHFDSGAPSQSSRPSQ